MKIIKINDKYYTFSFTDKAKTRREESLREEAAKRPDAVIARLMNNNEWDKAEDIMDEFMS